MKKIENNKYYRGILILLTLITFLTILISGINLVRNKLIDLKLNKAIIIEIKRNRGSAPKMFIDANSDIIINVGENSGIKINDYFALCKNDEYKSIKSVSNVGILKVIRIFPNKSILRSKGIIVGNELKTGMPVTFIDDKGTSEYNKLNSGSRIKKYSNAFSGIHNRQNDIATLINLSEDEKIGVANIPNIYNVFSHSKLKISYKDFIKNYKIDLNKFLLSYPKSIWAEDILWSLALLNKYMNNYYQSIAVFEQIAENYPNSKRTEAALVHLIEVRLRAELEENIYQINIHQELAVHLETNYNVHFLPEASVEYIILFILTKDTEFLNKAKMLLQKFIEEMDYMIKKYENTNANNGS